MLSDDIKSIEEARNNEIEKEINNQNLHFDRRVEEKLRIRIKSRNAPTPAPSHMRLPPILTNAQMEQERNLIRSEIRENDRRYIEQVKIKYDLKINEIKSYQHNNASKITCVDIEKKFSINTDFSELSHEITGLNHDEQDFEIER